MVKEKWNFAPAYTKPGATGRDGTTMSVRREYSTASRSKLDSRRTDRQPPPQPVPFSSLSFHLPTPTPTASCAIGCACYCSLPPRPPSLAPGATVGSSPPALPHPPCPCRPLCATKPAKPPPFHSPSSSRSIRLSSKPSLCASGVRGEGGGGGDGEPGAARGAAAGVAAEEPAGHRRRRLHTRLLRQPPHRARLRHAPHPGAPPRPLVRSAPPSSLLILLLGLPASLPLDWCSDAAAASAVASSGRRWGRTPFGPRTRTSTARCAPRMWSSPSSTGPERCFLLTSLLPCSSIEFHAMCIPAYLQVGPAV